MLSQSPANFNRYRITLTDIGLSKMLFIAAKKLLKGKSLLSLPFNFAGRSIYCTIRKPMVGRNNILPVCAERLYIQI